MILLGFKRDWIADPVGLEQYLGIIQHGLDLRMGVAILRLKSGLYYSNVIANEEQIDKSVHVVDETGKKKFESQEMY